MRTFLHPAVPVILVGWLVGTGCATMPAAGTSTRHPVVKAVEIAESTESIGVVAAGTDTNASVPAPQRINIEFRNVPEGYRRRIERTLWELPFAEVPRLVERSEHGANWQVTLRGDCGNLEAELRDRLPAGNWIPFEIDAPAPDHRIVTFNQGFR